MKSDVYMFELAVLLFKLLFFFVNYKVRILIPISEGFSHVEGVLLAISFLTSL